MIGLVLALVLAGPVAPPYIEAEGYWPIPGGFKCSAACIVPEPDGGTHGPGVGHVSASSQTRVGCKAEMERLCKKRNADASADASAKKARP